MEINKITLTFKLLENNITNNIFVADLIISNKTANDINSWKLCFDHFRPSETDPIKLIGESAEYAKLLKTIGEYNEIQGVTSIKAGSTINLKISGSWTLERYTDTPSCYFLIVENKNIIPITATSDLSIIPSSSCSSKVNISNQNSNNQLRLIPIPEKAEFIKGVCNFNKFNTILNTADKKEANEAISSFLKNLKPLINRNISVINKREAGTHISIENNSSLSVDSYNLNIHENNVIIEANSRGGYLYALISLFKLAEAYKNLIPCVNIFDVPRFNYRGTLLDVARNFRPLTELKKHLTMLAVNKINVLHCRMTDDEGWRLEIKKYPNIAEIGGYRGYEETLPPFHGSGAEKYGGYYTQKDMIEIINHANSLNITFLPEIVVPSHSRALLMSFNEYSDNKNPLMEIEDQSEYITAQNFTDNIMNPALDFTYTVLKDIYSELASLFDIQKKRNMPYSDYIHIGVDEVPEGAWMNSPACKQLMKKHNLKTTEEIQFYFISRIQKTVNDLGYKIAGWEEIVNGGTVLNKDLLVYSWQGEEAGFKAAEDGFPVIMTPVQYLYFDLAYSKDVKEPGLYWGGYNNPKIIYSYYPLSENTSRKIEKNIKGIQACLWSENLGFPRRTNIDKLPKNYVDCPYEYMSFPKMTAFSEVAWSISKNRSWENFVNNYSYEKAILDKFNIKYREDSID